MKMWCGMVAVVLVAGLALPANAGFLTLECDFPDDPLGDAHAWDWVMPAVSGETPELWLSESLDVVGPDLVEMSGETDSDPVFHVVKTVENTSGETWQSYWLTLSGSGDSSGVSFVPGSGASDTFTNVGEFPGNQMIFWVPDPVLDGETVTLEFDILVPVTGLFNFTLTQLPDTAVPEPATMLLMAVGGLMAARRRR